jgi:hypothetical protein
MIFLASGRQRASKYWPLFVFALCQMALWLFIIPLARFGWPWLAVLTLFACAPLDEVPVRKHRLAIPVILLFIAVIPSANELVRPIGTWPVVQGLGSEHAYMARMEDEHAGQGLGPPLAGIRELNRRYARHQLAGTVLIDTNMTAYADFPTIPGYYYLTVATLKGKDWWKADGPPFLSMAGKCRTDRDFLAELKRLNISSILAKKDTERVQTASDGRIHPGSGVSFPTSEQFNNFMDRWVQEGRASREEFSDSILYTIHEGPP